MKKIGLRKRFFSVLMALVLLVGSVSLPGRTQVHAANASTEYQITIKNFWGAASNTQLVCGYTGSVPSGSVFTGKVVLNGTETNVNWVVSGANFFLKKADGNVQIQISECTSIGVYAGSKMTARDGSYITIMNDCFYEKNASGTLVQGETPSPSPAEYPITINNFWGAASNTQLVCGYAGSVPSGSVFTGKVVLNGTETNVNWVVSGANFFLKKADGNVQITIAECTSIGVYAGSKMTASDGSCLTIQNDCFYEKNASGNLVATTVPSPEPEVPEPTDHTPATGIEIPEGVTVLKQVDFSGSDYQHSSSVGATTKNNVLVVGEDIYSRQLLYSNQLSADKTYILSYYVWVAEEDGVYDMHFDDAGSPNGIGGNYTANVLAQWSNLHSAYIKNCTLDGVATTASITGTTGGWKKVEVEWMPKGVGNVLIQLGDYGGQSQVTGITYIDDFLVYEKPAETVDLSTEVTRFASSSGLVAYTYANNELGQIADNRVFTGNLTIDGVESSVYWIKSGTNFVIRKIGENTNLLDTDITKLEVVADTQLTSSAGDIVTITNGLKQKKLADGSWVEDVETMHFSTDLSFYKVMDNGQVAFPYTNMEIAAFADGIRFVGSILFNGIETEIEWVKSGNCLMTPVITNYGEVTQIGVVEGTILTNLNGDTITINNDLDYIYSDGVWIENIPVTELETEVTFYRCNESLTAYAFTNEDIKEIADGTVFSGKLLIDKVEKEINWIKSGNCFVIQHLTDDDSFMRLEVPAGTKLIGSNATNITITNNVKHVKLEDSWMEDYGQTEIKYNDVKISFSSFDGRGFYLKAEIVAGPDKGKVIGTEAYGTWASRSEGLAYLNGTREMKVNYSPNVDMLYVSGSYDLDTLTSILFEEGTVLIPHSGAQNKTYMRLVNTLELEKEEIYGQWGEKGVIKTPTEFNDVKVSVYNVTGVKVVLAPTLTSDTDEKISDIYGNGMLCNGSVTYVDPDKGMYTNENASFYISGNQILLMDASIGLLDSVEIKAGTILWPSAASSSQVPIRITSGIMLTRNADDEWIYTVASGNVSNSTTVSGTSPSTGDTRPIALYLGALFVAIAGACGSVLYNRKRKNEIVK